MNDPFEILRGELVAAAARGSAPARRSRRPSLSTLIPVVATVCTLAVAGWFVLSLRGSTRQGVVSHPPASATPHLPVAQLVLMARMALRGLGDPHVKTALVVMTHKFEGENWMESGCCGREATDPVAYLTVLHGNFTCYSCSSLSNVPLRGHYSMGLWVPGVGGTDGGFAKQLPGRLDALGRVYQISLAPPPPLPASELALQPGAGLGPIVLGASRARLDHALGPELEAGVYALGPLEVITARGRHGHIAEIAFYAPTPVTIEGHPLDQSYARLHAELPSWRTRTCKEFFGMTMLEYDSPGGISTRLEFVRGRFSKVFIGRLSPKVCAIPPPIGP